MGGKSGITSTRLSVPCPTTEEVMGLRDREWFNEARNAPQQQQKARRASKPKKSLKEPSWLVMGLLCIAGIAVILWL